MIPSDADLRRYLRIAIYYGAGYLTAKGWDAGWVEFLSGVAIFLATFVWSVFGNRVRAKVAELAQIGLDPSSPVKGVVMSSNDEGKKMTAEIEGPVVTEGTAPARKMAAA